MNESDRLPMPNPVVDESSGTASSADPDAAIQPDDIEARREAMKTFEGKKPAVNVPIAQALEARNDDPA